MFTVGLWLEVGLGKVAATWFVGRAVGFVGRAGVLGGGGI